jgi:hypothetical protein
MSKALPVFGDVAAGETGAKREFWARLDTHAAAPVSSKFRPRMKTQ